MAPVAHRRTSEPAPGRAPWAAAALACLLLAGCGEMRSAFRPIEAMPPPANARPEPRSTAAGESPAPLVEFYASVEGELTASGRMRRETAPNDARYEVADLMRNFERIALFDEYVDVGGRFLRSETPALLRRWDKPIRVGVVTSSTVTPDQAARDRANVAGFTRRLARLTGLDMGIGEPAEVNYLVLFLSSAEQAEFAARAAERYPTFAPAVMDAVNNSPLDTFCTAYAFSEPENPAVYSAVLILIRAEHPPLTRLSCVHEEMSQAMGLPNDSPDARPSLFNDGLEFALLTEHDEILLRMLYDPRLRPGMTAAEVRPLLPEIARDALEANRQAKRLASLP